MRAAERSAKSGLGPGGRRPGAGRKPSTIPGILKRLHPEAAKLLTREIKAKAELIQVEIKLNLLKKGNIAAQTSVGARDGNDQNISTMAAPVQGGTKSV
jgi:hypothetical protein